MHVVFKRSLWCLLTVLAFAVLAEGLYVGAATYVLRSGALRSLLDDPRNSVRIVFATAHSTVPGVLTVEQLEVRGETDEGITWTLIAPQATVHLDLLALRRQEVLITDGAAQGVTFTLLTGGERPPGPPATVGAEAGEEAFDWTVRLKNLRFDHVARIEIDALAYAGELSVAGSLLVDRAGLSLPEITANTNDGTLTVAGEHLAHVSRSEITASLKAAPPSGPGSTVAERLTARLSLAADLARKLPFDYLLAGATWLDVANEKGHVKADVQFQDGAFLPGSVLAVESATLRTRFLHQTVTGSGRATLDVVRDAQGRAAARARVTLDAFTLQPAGYAKPAVVGHDLKIVMAGIDAGPVRPFRIWRVTIDAPPAEIHDLRFLESFLPKGLGLGIAGDSGQLGGRLEAASTPSDARGGTLRLTAKRLALAFEQLAFTTDLEATLQLGGIDLASGRLLIGGSKLRVERLTTEADGKVSRKTAPNWAGEVDVLDGTAQVLEPVSFHGSVHIAGTDLRPLVAVYAADHELPEWLQEKLALAPMTATARLIADPAGLAVLDANGAAGGLTLKGWLLHAETFRRGRALLRYGILSAGIGLEGKDMELKIIGAPSWFEQVKPTAHPLASARR